MQYSFLKNILCAALGLFVISSCNSSSNTIVIEEAPTGANDTLQQQQRQAAGPFKQLAIGENQPIRSLDPLYVENASGMRAVQLVYEGLVRYNAGGEIVPAIASEWAVSNNHTTYRFTLHDSLFYHDSSVFPNGRGRRLVAGDVKWAFERMAKDHIPNLAAHLFMNIRGFEPYFQEQHRALLPSDRRLDGISGIEVPNDSTVVFHLVEPDKLFVQKLAFPYAVVYPREAVTGSGFRAVGTGPYTYSQQRSDSLYIFAKYQDYRVPGQPRIDRIDIITRTSETALLNSMSKGNIQLIPELGPRQMAMAIDTTSGQLKSDLTDQYTLYSEKGVSGYFIRYNSGADLPRNSVENALAAARNGQYFPDLHSSHYNVMWSLSPSGNTRADSLAATFTQDPFVRTFYHRLSRRLAAGNIGFAMRESRVPTRNIPLYSEAYLPYYNFPMSMTPQNTLITISIHSQALSRDAIENLEFNKLSWWFNMRDVNLNVTNSR